MICAVIGVVLVAAFWDAAAATPAEPTAVASGPDAESPSSSDEAWSRAMALSDQQRYDEALLLIRLALDGDPASTSLLWLEAGVLGWSGRHEASVTHYERLLANHPELADDVRLELATQRLWAGDPRGALEDVEAELAKHPFNPEARRLRALALARSNQHWQALDAYDTLLAKSPDDLELQHDRATLLGWMGKNEKAVEAYSAILARHPDDLRARIGLALNENWRGNHRTAALQLEQLVEEGHDDPEILEGLAYAYYWDDRPEAARTALDRLTAARPQDPEAGQLSEMLLFEESATLAGGFEISDDSDDLRVETMTVDYRLPLAGQSAVMIMARDDHVRDPGGKENPFRLGAGFEKRWRDHWRASAVVWFFDPRNDFAERALGQASLTYRPDGRFQYAAGFAMEPVLTRESLSLGIRSTTGSAGLSWRVVDRVTVSADGQYRDYSDGNTAALASAAARWELPPRRKNRFALSFGTNLLLTDEDLDNGYYDPERYLEAGPGGEWTIELSRGATLGVVARGGYQWEKGNEGDPFYHVQGQARIPLGRAMRLVGQVERGTSSLGSASGFDRTAGAIYVTAAF